MTFPLRKTVSGRLVILFFFGHRHCLILIHLSSIGNFKCYLYSCNVSYGEMILKKCYLIRIKPINHRGFLLFLLVGGGLVVEELSAVLK